MKIENHGISSAADVRRTEQVQRRPAGTAQATAPEDTGDLLALSSGVISGGGDAVVEQLAAAWRAGAFRPDAGRIAEKLLSWGFDIRTGGV
jgi:hypothetical protein